MNNLDRGMVDVTKKLIPLFENKTIKRVILYNKRMNKSAAIKYVEDRIKSNHEFELEIKNILKIKHENNIEYHHLELIVNEILKLNYKEYK